MNQNEINQFLQFARSARLEFTLLIILSAGFLILPQFYDSLFGDPPHTDFSKTEAFAKVIIEKEKEKEENRKKTYSNYNSDKKTYTKNKPTKSFKKKKAFKNNIITERLFLFDPNKITKEKLIQLGFSERVTSTFLNYRNKGGKFYKKEDFKRVYGVTESDYELLEPFIEIEKRKYEPQKKEAPKPIFAKEEEPESIKIDVNKATIEDWQKLRGIGPFYAKKIVNFREKLGGFSSIQQIGTTYGLKDSTFQIIKPFLEVSPVSQQIKINSASEDELKNHPYISWKQANIVVKYRNNHGHFNNKEDLKKVIVFSEEDLEKLTPYIDYSLE